MTGPALRRLKRLGMALGCAADAAAALTIARQIAVAIGGAVPADKIIDRFEALIAELRAAPAAAPDDVRRDLPRAAEPEPRVAPSGKPVAAGKVLAAQAPAPPVPEIPPRRCERCGADIAGRDLRARYCSKRCGSAAAMARHRRRLKRPERTSAPRSIVEPGREPPRERQRAVSPPPVLARPVAFARLAPQPLQEPRPLSPPRQTAPPSRRRPRVAARGDPRRAEIDAWIAAHGVTKCPPGAARGSAIVWDDGTRFGSIGHP